MSYEKTYRCKTCKQLTSELFSHNTLNDCQIAVFAAQGGVLQLLDKLGETETKDELIKIIKEAE